VALRDDLNSCAPQLRRYARALVAGHPAPNKNADDLVQAVLLQALESGAALRVAGPDLPFHLAMMLTEWHRERLAAGKLAAKAPMEKENFAGRRCAGGASPLASPPRDPFAAALMALALEEREALLLVVLQGFSHAEAARILKISRAVLVARVARARAALGDLPAANFVAQPAQPLPSYLRVIK